MLPQTKKKAIWAILIASGIMILGYDLGMLLRNRLKPCDIEIQDCSAGYYCAKSTNETKARCLPVPAEPHFAFRSPLDSFKCVEGNLKSEGHSLDSSAFRLRLASSSGAQISASAAGTVYVYPESQEIRILHQDGYVTYYFPIQKPQVKSLQEVNAGDPIAKSIGELSFGVYYLNPGISYEAHKERIPFGFSVPFKLTLKDQLISSLQLDCSHTSGTKVLNH